MRILFLTTAMSLIVMIRLAAQKKITIEDLYQKYTFSQESVYGINWMNDGRFYSAQNGNDIVKYDVTTGEIVSTIVNGKDLNPSINIQGYDFSKDESKILILTERESIYRRSFVGEYYVYDLKTKGLSKLSKNGKQSYATFSPDGNKVAFVRDNNLFYVKLKDRSETQVTNDGKFNYTINGSTDWVYEEEYGFAKAFFWSPDGNKIAYYKFDESGVKEYNMQKWKKGGLYPDDYRFKYPKAGEDNSEVAIFIYHLDSGKKVKADTGKEKDIYIPRIKWTANVGTLSIRRMNRLQNKLEILHTDANTGSTTPVLTETSTTYVDASYCDDLTYLNDGKHFLHTSERDGYKHIYLYKVDGTLIRQITKGTWEVETFIGINQTSRKKEIYYISTEGSPLERYLFKIDLSGKRKLKLSLGQGYNQVIMSKDFQYYINKYSNAHTPLQVGLYITDGNKLIKQLEENQELKAKSKEYGLQPKEFFSFNTLDGSKLDGYMIKPQGFDSKKKYPLLIFQYSGPGSQQVKNAWGGRNYYWHQMLAQKGYIVAVLDTRGTGGKGEKFKKMTYKQLGKLEVEDHIEGAKYLGKMDFIDEARIGIWGWSFGGYVSSLAMMKGADVFKAGIAVAPVTNWRYYDTIYTERYLQRPQDNPSGYDDNSPTTHAEKLKGKFLLVHGTGDDNVHFQNSVVLQNALIANGKQFQSFYYPNRAHGIRRANARLHLYTLMTDFLVNNL